MGGWPACTGLLLRGLLCGVLGLDSAGGYKDGIQDSAQRALSAVDISGVLLLDALLTGDGDPSLGLVMDADLPSSPKSGSRTGPPAGLPRSLVPLRSGDVAGNERGLLLPCSDRLPCWGKLLLVKEGIHSEVLLGLLGLLVSDGGVPGRALASCWRNCGCGEMSWPRESWRAIGEVAPPAC